MDGQLTVKSAKFMSLENLYVYGIRENVQLCCCIAEKELIPDVKEDAFNSPVTFEWYVSSMHLYHLTVVYFR